MLKNDRVKHMTKMAMYEKQNKNDLRIVTEYRRKDYISMSRILAFIFGSIAFAVFYFGVVVLFLYNRFSNIHTRLIVLILLLGILLYVFFLMFICVGCLNLLTANIDIARTSIKNGVLCLESSKICMMTRKENRNRIRRWICLIL
jgi:uncharacterized protein YqhQ